MDSAQIEIDTTVRVGKTVITRIDQISRKMTDLLADMKNVREQIEVILIRGATRPNDVRELKDLYGQMDKIKERLEKVL